MPITRLQEIILHEAWQRWVVNLELPETNPDVILVQGYVPALGSREGFMLPKRREIPPRVECYRVAGVVRVVTGYYADRIICDPLQRETVASAIRTKLDSAGFISSEHLKDAYMASLSRLAPQ
ncbi:MAG: hypothetical protein EXR62_00260 [Chloroflexi bacterium]|nr:hypothetical protein [Chloroflexota bacterium]